MKISYIPQDTSDLTGSLNEYIHKQGADDIDVTFNAYAGQTRQPDIEAGPNSLKLVLHRRGEKRFYLETKI